MRICVIGAGYVGLVSAVCFAEMGNRVICVEQDAARVAGLAKGQVPIYEPGLEALLKAHLASGQLSFTEHLALGVAQAEIVFIAVGTPSGEDGSADLSHVLAVADALGACLQRSCIVVDKSTVPVGTGREVARIVRHIPDPYRRPQEVADKSIPLASRIIRAVNAFDDLVGGSLEGSRRFEALERLRLGMVYDFDPKVVETLSRIVERNTSFAM